MQSPYMFKELPGAVLHLQAFIRDVRVMLREDVPALIVEVKRLRQENKRLEARLDALENQEMVDSVTVIPAPES
jgi:regulator of replication initiation timing